MFRFFKRKKGPKEGVNEAPQQEAAQPVVADSVDDSIVAQTPDAHKADVAEDTVSLSSAQLDRSGLAKQESLQIDNSAFREVVRPQAEATAEPQLTAPLSSTDVSSAAQPDLSADDSTPAQLNEAVVDTSTEAEPEPEPEPEPEMPVEPAPAPKGSWLSRLRKGLSRTGQSIGGIFVGVKVDEELFDELEMALIMSDAGVEATEKLLTALRARVRKERLNDASQVKTALKELLADHLRPLEKTFDLKQASPLVVMIAGVNGAGKTTSIGKLANAFQAQGASVLLAAGDTFRAAAREQLVEWGSRNNVAVIAQDGGDPAAVAFDAVNAGKARQMDVVMVDTAGRLPTQLNLMEELKKIKRVTAKADGSAPHEVLLVVDGNTGQNALSQIKAFDAAIGLTGLVVTKLDGTAKGGTLAAVAAGTQGVRPVPVYWIGVGEGMQDLQPFVASEFASALVGD